MKKGNILINLLMFVFFVTFTSAIILLVMKYGNSRDIKLASLIGFAVVLLIYVFRTYNKLITLKLKSEQSEKTIDVYLKQRFDLIPNIVENVKAYSEYEKETLTQIIELRQKYITKQDKNSEDFVDADNQFNNFLVQLEAYPELKADESYLNLQKNLSKIENQLQSARRIYNMETTSYNIYIHKFPSNIFASIFRFKDKSLFQALNEEKENVSV